jgi:multimeric flavodoxin WrbA
LIEDTHTAIKILGIESSPRRKNSPSLFDSLSGIMLQGVLEIAGESAGVTTERINLSACRLNPCRGCFSDMETRCHFLCDCHEDDFQQIALQMINADAVVFATPTYMCGMSAMLKLFFERWISFKAPPVDSRNVTKSLDECFVLMRELVNGRLDISNPLQGKVGGIVVAGSEIGQASTVKDILYMLNLYGFILPPQCFIYHTGHSMQPLEDVRRCFYENRWLQAATSTMARAMVQLIQATKPLAWDQMQHTLESS